MKYKLGYDDGSGKEIITLNGEAIAKCNWGCSCCQDETTQEQFENAKTIVNPLNEVERLKSENQKLKEAAAVLEMAILNIWPYVDLPHTNERVKYAENALKQYREMMGE